ncbi:MAG: (d)CMP kinase [Candidatus Micrarchaeota archaeon]
MSEKNEEKIQNFPGSKYPGPSDIICISGLAGAGKNTVAEIVGSKLGWIVVQPTFKILAKKAGMSLEEFQAKARENADIDKKFDNALRDACKDGKVVVSTWLGPWMAPGKPFRVWIDVPLDVRAKRVSGREGQSVEEAKKAISKRDEGNKERYMKIYKINIYDHSGFDLIVSSDENTKPEETAEKILDAHKKRKI